jgi:rhodanese-related sulfurtransferase
MILKCGLLIRKPVKFIIDNWMLISVALVSGALLLWPVIMGASTSGLTASGAVHLINREKAVVIDVSEPGEFAAAHVNGSKNVPMADFEKRLPEVVKNKALPVILVCTSGIRATKAIAMAKKLGYEQAQALGGGLVAWRAANLPLEKA